RERTRSHESWYGHSAPSFGWPSLRLNTNVRLLAGRCTSSIQTKKDREIFRQGCLSSPGINVPRSGSMSQTMPRGSFEKVVVVTRDVMAILGTGSGGDWSHS